MKSKFQLSILVALTLFGSEQAVYGGNLTGPFDLENTFTLPKGVNSPRFRSLWLSMSQKYNGEGQAEDLGAKLNKRVTYSDLAAAQPTMAQSTALQGSVLANGQTMSDSPFFTSGVINTDVQVTVASYTRGITENFTGIVAVPVYKINVQADTGVVATANGLTWMNSLDPAKRADAVAKANNAINGKATGMGYQEIKSGYTNEIGDVKVGGKYRFYKEDDIAVAAKVLVSTPTGTAPNADKVVDTATGDGAYSVGTTLVSDYQPTGKLRITAYGTYLLQPEDQLDRRIPTAPTESLSPDKDFVKRDRGDQLSAGTQVYLGEFNRGFSGGVGYLYQHMNATSFKGSKFSEERYRWLEGQFPEQTMQSVTAAVQFSTIDYFKEKKFFYPFTSQLVYSKTLAGTNVPTADVVSAELVMFF